MKKTQFTDAVKNIKKRWASFLSVVLIVALGTGGFFASRNMKRSFVEATDRIYQEGNFKNFDMLSSGGVSEEDLRTIESTEGVKEAEGVILLDAELSDASSFYNVKVISITDTVSTPILIEGNMPQKDNEILLNEDVAIESGIQVGDTVHLKSTTALSKNPLKNNTYTVSGIMRHPEYVRYTMVRSVALPESAFNMEALNDSYTNAFVTADEEALDKLYDLLPTLNAQTKKRMDLTAEERIAEKTEEIQKKFADAEAELNRQEQEGLEQLDEAERKIREFESVLRDGRSQIEAGRRELASAYNQLISGENEYNAANAQLQQAKNALNQANQILAQIQQETGLQLTLQELADHVNTLDNYLTNLITDIEAGTDTSDSLNMLLGFLMRDEAKEICEKAGIANDVLSVIIDLEKSKETAERLKSQLTEMEENSRLEDGIRYMDYYTPEGLDRILQIIETRVNTLKDAITNGSEEEIAAAREALTAFFESNEMKALDHVMIDNIYESLEYHSYDIINAESTVDSAAEDLKAILAQLESDGIPSVAPMKEALAKLTDLTTAYLSAVQSGEDVEVAAQNFYDYCETAEAQMILPIVNDYAMDIDDYIEYLKNSEDLETDLNGLLNITSDIGGWIFNIVPAEEEDVEDREEVSDSDVAAYIEKLKDFSNLNVETDDIEEMMSELYSTKGEGAVYWILKNNYGYDMYEGTSAFNNSIEVQFAAMRKQFEDLKASEDLAAMAEKQTEYLQKIDEAATKMISDATEENADGVAEEISNLNKVTSDFDFMTIEQIIESYFGFNFQTKSSDFVSVEGLKQVSEKVHQLSEQVAQVPALPSQIADGERELASARNTLDNGWSAYRYGLAQLQSKEKILNSSEEEIAAARRDLNASREEAMRKLEDARKQLEDTRKEAEDEIAKAREEVLSQKYVWLLQDRTTNLSNLDVNGTIAGIQAASVTFGALFLLVISLVCFSTIAMIVEEENKSVGTTKAFGFYNREIFGKYLLFGVSAAIVGCICGVIISHFVSKLILQNMMNQHMYMVGELRTVHEPLTIVLTSLFIIALSALATFIACTDLLKSPAALLMKGDTISSRDRKMKRKESSKRSGKSLYSRLILRNIVNEKERVLITVLIVALSCFVVGVGFQLRDSFYGMMVKQKQDVMIYDFRIEYKEETTEAEINEIENILNSNKTDYMNAYYGMHLYDTGKTTNGLYVIAGDENRLNEFISLEDTTTKKQIALPDDGIAIQIRLSEVYGYQPGDTLNIYTSDLIPHTVPIKGVFTNFQGRYVIASDDAYESLFNEKLENNCYYVKLNGADYNSIAKELSAVTDTIAIERADSYLARLNSTIGLYNLMVVIMTGMAILMSFMILTNLSNIFLTRKKKELIVMRINGFSISQTINYLAKETVLTTLIGVALAVILGGFLGTFFVRMFEHTDTMFARGFDVKGWAIAAVLECLFSFIINFFVFRKVKKLNFRELT